MASNRPLLDAAAIVPRFCRDQRTDVFDLVIRAIHDRRVSGEST